MSDFKRIPVLIDAAAGKQIDEFGAVVRDNAFFRLLFDETVILCCQFYDLEWLDGEVQLNTHPIDPGLTLAAFGNNVFDPAVSLMFLSEQSSGPDNKVNIVGDWFEGATADPASGQLSFRIDTNTARFSEVLENSSGMENFYFCITGIPDGQTEKSVLAYFRFKAENRPGASSGAPAGADPEYFTALEVQALLNGKLDQDFSGFDTKTELADGDTAVFNDSEDSGNAIVVTMLKIWNYIKSKADTIYAAISHSHIIGDVTGLGDALDGKEDTLGFTPADSETTVNSHALTGNITLTANDIGLGNVDNTSDADKPVSTAQQAALDAKKKIVSDTVTVTNGSVVLDAYRDIYNSSVSADTTFTFDVSGLGTLTNKVVTFELHIDMTVVSTLTFPVSVSWLETPLLDDTKTYALIFRSTDGGTNWLGNLAYEV